jgi:GTP-binding protein HflX
MAKKVAEPTRPPKERAFLVGAEIRSEPSLLSLEDSVAELSLLADTAGLAVIGEAFQKLDSPNPNTFIGPGKVEEIKALVEETLAQVVVFDNELSPRHLRELEERFGADVRVLDRTALILDIFGQHANTREGILQVELAQYEYRLPRLTRVHKRISTLKAELEKVRAHRMRYRAQRQRSQIPIVALVGYTNSGKSTLLNRMAKADVYVADQLFATLDPTTRRVELPGGHWALFTDTVGFIQKLPTQLIAAFRATLEEIAEADLLLHVVDITHPNALEQARAVHQTLKDIDASHIPVITVLNKIDRFAGSENVGHTLQNFGGTVAAVSALTGSGMQELLSVISRELYDTFMPIKVRLPYQEGNLISLFHDQGKVTHIDHTRGGVVIDGNLPVRLLARFQAYQDTGIELPEDEPADDRSI